MTASLPTPGASSNVWATQLNAFLNVGHNPDGTIPGGSLGYHQYGPNPQVNYQVLSTAGTTWTAMDTTNLTLSITVPSTGNFFVDVGADWAMQSASGLSQATDMFMGLAIHNTTTLICPAQSWWGMDQHPQVGGQHAFHRYYVIGQTPQATLQFDLVMAMSATTDIAFATFYAEDGTVAGGELVTADPAAPITIHAFAM